MGYGVIGSTADSGSVSLGSSPSTPAIWRNPSPRLGFWPVTPPLCSGLARRPLKAVARVRLPSGVPTAVLNKPTPSAGVGLFVMYPELGRTAVDGDGYGSVRGDVVLWSGLLSDLPPAC